MDTQKSFINDKPTLYIVSTPIGNLADITYRAIETLNNVDAIFAEDSRVTLVLLKHYGIKKPLFSYHEHNKDLATKDIITRLSNKQSVALVSDAGTPLISDPGSSLVNEVIMQGFNAVSIPGASAFLSGLSVSGLDVNEFTFLGFISPKKGKRINILRQYIGYKTLVFYETALRLKDFLADAATVFGDCRTVVCRELTKKFEEIIRGTVKEIIDSPPILKGELVIILDVSNPSDNQNVNIFAEIKSLVSRGVSANEAIKIVSKDLNVRRQDVYKIWLNKEGEI